MNVRHVAVVGPDGAGKTTLASAIEDELADQGWKVDRLRPRPVPLDTMTNKDFDYTDPHALPHRNLIRSLSKAAAKFVWAWFAYGRAMLRHRRSDVPVVVLEERGWLDHGVDNRRYRIHPTAAAVFRRGARLVPQADRLIVLVGDARTLADRKGELTADEVARQVALWKQLGGRRSEQEVLLLDTTAMTVDEAAGQALAHVVASG